MSICPNCHKKVKMGSANKRKIRGVWHHKLGRCSVIESVTLTEVKQLVRSYFRGDF